MLPLAEQGKFTYVFASYMALLLLNVAGVFQGAAVRAPMQDESYFAALARLQLLQALLLSLLVCAAWLLAGNFFGWQINITDAGLIFGFLFVQQMADFDRRAAYIFSNTKRAIISSASLYPLRIIALIVIRPDTLPHVLEILALSALFPAVVAAFTVCRKKPLNIGWKNVIKEHLAYSKLFIAGAPLSWLWSYIPIFMLGVMHGKEQAALLASIRSISNIANVLMEQLETKVVADWGRLRHGGGLSGVDNAVLRLLKMGAAFWLFGLLIVLGFGREIVSLVLGTLYVPHWHLLVIGWIGYGVYFLARVSGIKHRTLGDNHVEFAGNLLGVLVALLIGLLLIPPLKTVGAAWLYVIIALAMLFGQMYLTRKLVRK